MNEEPHPLVSEPRKLLSAHGQRLTFSLSY